MNDIIKNAKSLINCLPDDCEDYPDMSLYRMVKRKMEELEEAIKNYKTPEVFVYVEGGLVQGARANTKDIAFEVFDVDNLKADEGKSRDEIEDEWNELTKDTKAIF